MAVSAWVINNYAKLKIGNATINLSDTGLFRLALYTASASATLVAGDVSVQGSLAGQASGGGYTAGGEALAGVTWLESGGTVTFDSTAWVVTGSIAAIKYAVIVASVGATSGHILAYSKLSTANFAVTGSNTLTITPNASGIFTLT